MNGVEAAEKGWRSALCLLVQFRAGYNIIVLLVLGTLYSRVDNLTSSRDATMIFVLESLICIHLL